MEIRFTLTREDLWHFLLYAYFKRGRRLWEFILVLYAILTLWNVIISWPAFSFSELWPLWLLLIFFAFLLLNWRRVTVRAAGKGGEHVVRITPEGMREKTDLAESLRSWKTFKAITQDTHNFYCIADTMGTRAIVALIIPMRAFATPQDAETFLQEVRQQWRQGQERTLAQAADTRPNSEQEESSEREP